MCAHGDTLDMQVWIPARLSHSGQEGWETKPVDRCIAHIVEALLDAGVMTVGSCCGHGKNAGSIALDDGRELLVVADRDQAEWLQTQSAIYRTEEDEPEPVTKTAAEVLAGVDVDDVIDGYLADEKAKRARRDSDG